MIWPVLLAAATPQPCEARIVDYRGWRAAKRQKWDLSLASRGGGALSIVGAQHSRDPDDPQFARIAAAFAKARPTLVFFEGPDRGTADAARAAITEGGESGYVRFLAKGAAIPARSLEPSPIDQAAALATLHSGDRVVLFYVLREAARLRDREGRSGEALDAAVIALLGRMKPLLAKAGIATTVTDLPSLSAAASREWPGRDWHALPGGWFAPDAMIPAAKFLPEINAADSAFRNRHMTRLFAEAAIRRERVFVVVGRNHVPMIAPALRCALS